MAMSALQGAGAPVVRVKAPKKHCKPCSPQLRDGTSSRIDQAMLPLTFHQPQNHVRLKWMRYSG